MKLRIAHFPQIPCKPFYVEVKDLEQARLMYDALANYDLFQYNNNIKGDYNNATDIQMYEDGEWVTWYDDETGIGDIHEYFDELVESGAIRWVGSVERGIHTRERMKIGYKMIEGYKYGIFVEGDDNPRIIVATEKDVFEEILKQWTCQDRIFLWSEDGLEGKIND